METSILRNKKFQFIVRLIASVSFVLFILYQFSLVFLIEANKVGRLVGIFFYILITVAAFLNFFDSNGVWLAHAILLIAGLVLLFAMRLLNLTIIFGELDFSSPPTVLNCMAYVLSQLGTLVLIAGYLVLRASSLENREIRKLATVLMSVAIVLYVLCFISESLLMIIYHGNIDISLKFTLLSRFFYCMGYVCTAVSFILPAPKRKKEKKRQGEFYYSDDDDEDIELVI